MRNVPMQGLGVMHSSYSSAAAEAAESAALEAKRAMDALLESIREQKGELQAFAERQIAVSEGFLSATKQMAQGACAAATSIQSQAETTK